MRANARTAALDAAYTEDHRGVVGQQRQGFLHGEQHALDVAVEGVVEMLFGDLPQWQHRTAASVGEQHVDVAALGLDTLVEGVELVEAGRVDLDAGGVADLGHGSIQFGLAAAGDVDVGAFLGEAFGGRQADAGGAAGDDCDFAFKFASHDVSPIR